MSKAVMLSYRFGGTDGVSVEAAKWDWALGRLGYGVRRVAGVIADRRPGDVVLPWLAMKPAGVLPRPAQLAAAIGGADLVIVENVCSLPLNAAAARAVTHAVARCARPVVFHHHDLPWQHPTVADTAEFPPDVPGALHVTINERTRRELASRGIAAVTVYNAFDVDAAPGDRSTTRRRFGFGERDVVVLQPSRLIARKNVPGGVRFAGALARCLPGRDVRFWVTGPAEDEAGEVAEQMLAGGPVPVTRGLARRVADAYAAADVVVLPSTWEGFGNPVVESIIARRPVAVHHYPVLDEILALGFRLFSVDQPEAVASWLASPDQALLERNLEQARRHLALVDLPTRLEAAFATAGWRRRTGIRARGQPAGRSAPGPPAALGVVSAARTVFPARRGGPSRAGTGSP